jgi:predicted enzyme related to lactoylglutathione lyase
MKHRERRLTMAISLVAISVDGSDMTRLAKFWADVLGQPVNPGATESSAAITTRDGLLLLFHRVPEGKVVKNRVHPDLSTTEYEAETDRLIKLGAVKLNDFEQGGSRWTTFADPEGNEFDLIARTA